MGKTDLAKTDKAYYTAKNKPQFLDIGKAQFLSISGKGDPSGKVFSETVEALYATAYTVKFMCKALDKDFVVAKLEGLWSFDKDKYANLSIDEAPVKIPRDEWSYQLMIRMPDYVNLDQVTAAVQTVVTKKGITRAKEIQLYSMTEGKSVQALHTGPFANEPETLKLLQDFMELNGLLHNGAHHEIYLSDFRKTDPQKLRTILREPVRAKG